MSTCCSLGHIRYPYSLQSNQSLITCLSFWMDLLLLCSTFALRWPFDFRSIWHWFLLWQCDKKPYNPWSTIHYSHITSNVISRYSYINLRSNIDIWATSFSTIMSNSCLFFNLSIQKIHEFPWDLCLGLL